MKRSPRTKRSFAPRGAARALTLAAIAIPITGLWACSVYDGSLTNASVDQVNAANGGALPGASAGAGDDDQLGGGDTSVLAVGGSSSGSAGGAVASESAAGAGSQAAHSGGTGSAGAGGNGTTAGGMSAAGAHVGGSSGRAGAGGASPAGASPGGANAAGTSSGGASAGGANAGGANAGGASASGASAGGASAGGASAGGASSGATGAGGAPTELAHSKGVTASSQQPGNIAIQGNDGDMTTRWCGVNETFPQWWRVDLGANYRLSDFSVSFQHPERVYTYKVETSVDDSVYALRASLSGMGAVQSAPFPLPQPTARYVRITVTAAAPLVDATGTHNTWACFYEFAVNGY